MVKFGGLDNTFDPSNQIAGQDVEDLDLFLLPAGWDDPYEDSIPMLSSVSSDDNVEHIYANVQPGNYEIVVYQFSGGDRDYGLAWWTGNAADFDQDGDVDHNDLSDWRMDFGSGFDSDADFDTDSDGNDFLVWQRNLGAGSPATPAVASVPEPGMSLLCCLALPLLTLGRRSMIRRAAALLIVIGVGAITAKPADAANLELTRNSRHVTTAEAAGGAPGGGVIHDFFVTSDADLLVLGANLNVPVYEHVRGSNRAQPDPELVARFPALGASSYFQLPSETILFGRGFAMSGPESAWGDLANDGPQNQFHFGRLTTAEAGVFAGSFFVRGEAVPITVPFTFTLPGSGEGLSASLSERLSVSVEEPRETPPPPPAPVGPDPNDFTSPDFRGHVTIELTRRSRPVSSPERLFRNAPGYVHQFFVTTTTDLISIGSVEIEGNVYQHAEGSNRKPPNARVLKIWPDASADSFITTPGDTLGKGGGFYGTGETEIVWYDDSDDGPLDEFLFAQLTVSQTGSFAGAINVRGPNGRVTLPFEFALPGTESDFALLDGEQSYRLELSFDELAADPAGQVPEPHAWLLAAVGLPMLLRRRLSKRLSG